MKEKKVFVYEGTVASGWGGICLGKDTVASITERIESFQDSGKKVKVKIEYDLEDE